MVSASRTEGGPQILSAGVRKTIQSIKEIVGNHSDAEIYITLKETNMDPNETTQKLLNQGNCIQLDANVGQDPFHVVKRKRDKRKEVATNKVHTASQPRTHTEHLNQGPKFNTHAEHIIRRGGFVRNSLPDAKVSIEFRVVRDNRTNHDANGEIKPPSLQGQISANEVDGPKLSEKSNLVAPNNQKQPLGRPSSQSSIFTDIQPRQARDVQLSDKKDSSEGKPLLVSKAGPQVQTGKANDSQPNTATSSNNSVAGVYSSSSDPVHVPSPDSRPAANIGAIKREVGAVGRRLSTEGSPKISSAQSGLSPNSHLGRDGPLRDSLRSSTATSKSSQPKQAPVHELATRSNSINRPIMGNHNISRQHQVVGHQKASSQSNKEWKPKSSRKQSSGPGIIGAPAKSSSPSADASKNLEADSTQLQANVSRIKVAENQNVIIAPHIRVSETDRCRVTFGSLGTELEQSRNPGFQAGEVAEETHIDASASISNATPESSGDESSGSKQVELLDERGGNSGTRSPASAAVSEQQSTDRKESSNPQDLDNYADVGLVRDSSPSYTLSESQQQQDPPQLPIFSAYEAQTMYDIPYFRSTVDETSRVQNLQFPQEALSSHTVHSIPASTIAMVQQQQTQQLTQMYPQVHVSHYANLMPYRQFVSPFYVPPMAVPGYSSNAAYPHPSNGNSYLLMPGGSSHLSANGVKYGIQQFKPVPTGSPTGFGNFSNGYAINAPGVGGAAGLEDSSGLKFKDRSMYVPNPQAETSEIWMSSRDLPSMQSGSYYNMPGQTTHASYLPSHTSHASFNAAGQSSHMQFPSMYHPQQPAGIPSPHHLSPAMGGNIGVGVAAGGTVTQVNAYQQPQVGHMNWTGKY